MKKKLFIAMAAFAAAVCMPAQAQTTGFEDVSSTYLTNAALDNSGEGWTLEWENSGDGSQGWLLATDTENNPYGVNCAEFYAGWYALALTSYSIKQTVTLPAGSYKISVYAFYRYGLFYNTDASKSLAYVYATPTSGDKVTNPVVTLGGATSHVLSSYANSMSDAAQEFSNGNYKSTALFEITEEQEVELGLEGTHELKQSWFILGPFTLEKFNWTISTDDEWTSYFEENSPSGTMSASVKSQLNSAEETFKASPIFSNYQAYMEAVDAATASISAYAQLSETLSSYDEKVESLDETIQTAYNDAVSTIRSSYEAGTYSDDEIASAIEAVEIAYMTASGDGTGLLVNPDFSAWTSGGTTGFPTGWTVGQSPSQQNYWNLSSSALEVWAPSASEIGTFDIYQELTDLPAGVYRIGVEMANGNNGESTSANGAAGLYAQVGNDVSFAGCTINATNATEYSDYTVLVTVGEGETLRLGLKNVATMTARWFSADNFTLEYLGTDVETVDDADAQYLINMGSAALFDLGVAPEYVEAANEAITALTNEKSYANYEAAQAAMQVVYANAGKYVSIEETETYTPAAKEGMTVDLTRTLKADRWNTLVLPFAVSNAELTKLFGDDVQVAEFSSFDGDGVTVSFETMDEPAITANVPVIVKPSTEDDDNVYRFDSRAIVEGTPSVEGTGANFVGSYTYITDLYNEDTTRDLYGISNNKLYLMNSDTQTTLKVTCAYLSVEQASEVKLLIDGEETDATAINGLSSERESLNGAIYTVSGQRVNNVSKGGLYIVNGKKVLVK